MSGATTGRRIAWGYARIVVALRWPIIVAWLAALGAAVAFLPGLGGAGTAPLTDIVPADAQAIAVQERALRLFGWTTATDTLVVERNARGLPPSEFAAQARAAVGADSIRGVRAAVPVPNVPAPGVRWHERGTTIVTYLFLTGDLNLHERDHAARTYLDGLPSAPRGTVRGITGAGPAQLEQWSEIDAALPWVEAATVVTILLIVALYFRSLAAPLLTLATAALAYVVAARALAWSAERLDVTAPSEVEPVLVVLLLGIVTDYTVFFMAETRRSLRRGAPRLVAAREAVARVAPLVLAAGLLVAGGVLSLLAAKLHFFRVFGPGLAVAALTVTLVSVTLVPAIVAVAGPWLFGSRVRAAQRAAQEAANSSDAGDDDPPGRGARVRRFVSRLPTARPVAALLVVVCIGTLAVAALGTRTISLSVSLIPSLPAHSEARRIATAAAQGFAPGILGPTEVLIEAPAIGGRTQQLAQLQRLLAADPGVAEALGPAQARGARLGVFVSPDGGAARIVLVLGADPTGADAIATIRRLERRVPQLLQRSGLPAGTRVSWAGQTPLADETVDALLADLVRVAIATALVVFVLLAVFLRALVAPVLLLLGSLLAFTGSFGLMALLAPHVLGTDEIVYYVPLVAAVLLVGLGSDYNVFIAGRIREEAHLRGLRDAVAVGAGSASRTISVAGVTLAATFALLALIPLRPFRELALTMFIGVLVDALIVRSILIPALIALVGRATWWPRAP